MTRAKVVVVFVLAELWQFVVGAGSSLQLAAPGVGDDAVWVPNVLVGETYTLLPLGFVLCLLAAPWTRVGAAVCAVASLLIALAAVAYLVPAPPVDVVGVGLGSALLAVPGLCLLVCAVRVLPGWHRPSGVDRSGAPR